MKIDPAAALKGKKRKPAPEELRFKLTRSFVLFGLLLLALLWAIQTVFFDMYYEYAMGVRCKSSLEMVSFFYRTTEGLSYEDFCSYLGDVAEKTDVYFFVEASDGSFVISSSDAASQGRTFLNSLKIIEDAKLILDKGGTGLVNYTVRSRTSGDTIIYASLVSSSLRDPVYIFAIASLTPVASVVKIIRSQLLIVMIVALLIGAVVAAYMSRRLADPVIKMKEQAKILGTGNYDVVFEGAEYLELDSLADTLNQAATGLKAADALQKDFLANVSHDLRTPLTMIKSYAELVKDISGDNKEKRDEHLSIIIGESDRLNDLVNDLLLLSKMQAGAEEFSMEDFDIAEVGRAVFQTFRVMENEGFEMIFDAPEESLTVRGDRRRIQQVISNLVSNAVKYSGNGRYVRMTFSEAQGSVRCSVEDRGIGIKPEDAEIIWNRYQRASSKGYREKESTGLGLSISAQILKAHGADYGVDSVPGEGSTFWFEIKRSSAR